MFDLSNSLINSMCMASFIIAMIGVGAFWIAWNMTDNAPTPKGEPTQRMRYFFLLVATLASFGSVMFIVWQTGWRQTNTAIQVLWTLPPTGWIINTCYIFGLLCPLLTIITVVRIYANPCKMAKRVREGWVTTEAMRKVPARQREVVRPYSIPNSSGGRTKYYRSVGRNV